MKVIGLLSGFNAYLVTSRRVSTLLALSFAGFVIWYAVRLSKQLRSGNTRAAIIITVWVLLWVALGPMTKIPWYLNETPDPNPIVLGIVIVNLLPVYFCARGLLAFGAYKRRSARTSGEAEPLRSNPWEVGAKLGKHPAFVNKRKLRVYLFLMLLPFLLICAIFLLAQDSTHQSSASSDPWHFLGKLTGALAVGGPLWYIYTGMLYRRARIEALQPATELRKENPRAILLYLRSFVDDDIKMRARAANGRSWLERLIKIAFEEVIVDHLWRYGPILGIGKPGDNLPPLGAARDYVSDQSWQQTVEQLMAEASMILMVVGRTEGPNWELSKVMELGLTHKLVLLLPPAQLQDLQMRWDNLRDRATDVSEVMLPRDVDLERTRAVVPPGDQNTHIITSDRRDD